jgi:hypothetical protein
MNKQNEEIKKIASQLLTGMLSNPHIYPQVSDEGGYGNMEQQLVILSVEIAEKLIEYIDNSHSRQREIALMSKK